MAENYSFRSSVSGFNRSDVLSFIEEIIAEKETLKNRVAELEKLCSEKDAVIAGLDNSVPGSSKCDNCDVAKKYEARLGAAMFDAKRFSEILVQEANNKAHVTFTKASSAAAETSGTATEIADEIRKTAEEFDTSLRGLYGKISGIAEHIDAFNAQINKSSEAFFYKTEFSDDSAVVAETPEKVVLKPEVKANESVDLQNSNSIGDSILPEKNDLSDNAGASSVNDEINGFKPNFNFLRNDADFSIRVEKDD